MDGLSKLKPSKYKALQITIYKYCFGKADTLHSSYLRKTTMQILPFNLSVGRNLWKPGNPEENGWRLIFASITLKLWSFPWWHRQQIKDAELAKNDLTDLRTKGMMLHEFHSTRVSFRGFCCSLTHLSLFVKVSCGSFDSFSTCSFNSGFQHVLSLNEKWKIGIRYGILLYKRSLSNLKLLFKAIRHNVLIEIYRKK